VLPDRTPLHDGGIGLLGTASLCRRHGMIGDTLIMLARAIRTWNSCLAWSGEMRSD